jgi:hypothetical protein
MGRAGRSRGMLPLISVAGLRPGLIFRVAFPCTEGEAAARPEPASPPRDLPHLFNKDDSMVRVAPHLFRQFRIDAGFGSLCRGEVVRSVHEPGGEEPTRLRTAVHPELEAVSTESDTETRHAGL